jgi:parallel beta-helix repeat protein
MATKISTIWNGRHGIRVPRLTMAAVVIMATAIVANAQDLGQTGASPVAVTKISQPGKFPININKSGSYRLNSNLTVKKSGVDAIDINVPNVTIDLSGFTITGGVIAINGLTSVQIVNVTVSGGSITGSGAGVLLGNGGVVRNVRVSNLSGSGTVFANAITCGDSCIVSGNTVYDVTASNPSGPSAAIAAGENSLITNNSVTGTVAGSGIVLAGNSAVSGNAVSSNASAGILIVGSGVIVTRNTVSNNASGLNFVAVTGGYGENVLLNNATDVSGGTSLAGGNTNLCTAGAC